MELSPEVKRAPLASTEVGKIPLPCIPEVVLPAPPYICPEEMGRIDMVGGYGGEREREREREINDQSGMRGRRRGFSG
jgi:hypothetical protein